MLNFTINEEKCTKCGLCTKECPVSIIKMEDYPTINSEKEKNCIRCQHCLAVCPTAALSILGKDPKDSVSCKATKPVPDEMMNLIRTRRSIRKYKDENVDKKILDEILETSLYAPTGHNTNSVLFSVIDNKEDLAKFRETTYTAILKHADDGTIPKKFLYLAKIASIWKKRGVDIMFRNAPHMLITSAPSTISSPLEDSVIALSYFELLANTNDIGVLWNGMINWALKHVAPELTELLNIPEGHTIGYVLIFGKSATKYARGIQSDHQKINRITL